jgi:hypothetical protein
LQLPISQTFKKKKKTLKPSKKQLQSYGRICMSARNIGRIVMGLCWRIFLRLMPALETWRHRFFMGLLFLVTFTLSERERIFFVPQLKKKTGFAVPGS